ncbi:MAG: hypothetical protein ACI965_000757 [Paraglaciecola sp.]
MGLLAKLFKALNSDASPWQLAFGIMFGMLMGLTPLLGLHSLLILFTVLFLRVNLSTFILSWLFFSGLSIPLSSIMVDMGEASLNNKDLNGIWTYLYSTYIGQLSQFYHTLTLGSLMLGVLLAPPVLVLSKILIVQYRARLMAWVNKLKIVEFIKGSNLYRLYQALGE